MWEREIRRPKSARRESDSEVRAGGGRMEWLHRRFNYQCFQEDVSTVSFYHCRNTTQLMNNFHYFWAALSRRLISPLHRWATPQLSAPSIKFNLGLLMMLHCCESSVTFFPSQLEAINCEASVDGHCNWIVSAASSHHFDFLPLSRPPPAGQRRAVPASASRWRCQTSREKTRLTQAHF